jgi:DNA primase
VVILVESPGNVWRLEEAGIHNSVAIFGSSLSDRQKMILDTSGAMTIITIMDNDDAGQKASQLISDKCSKTYNIVHAKINYPDVACMTVDQIKTELYPQLGFVL